MDLLLLWKGGASQAGLPQASKPATLWSAKDHTQEETALQGVGPRVRLSRQLRTKVLGVPTQAPILITPEEPWVPQTLHMDIPRWSTLKSD